MSKYSRRTVLAASFALMVVSVCLSFQWLDLPVARAFAHNLNELARIGAVLDSPVLVALICAFVVGSAAIFGRRMHPLHAVLLIGAVSSLFALVVNDIALKMLFGVETPQSLFTNGTNHVLHLTKGTRHSSFPSGHMAMVSVFATVVLRRYPNAWILLSAVATVIAVLLVVGGWHFISDVIAGAWCGFLVGVFAPMKIPSLPKPVYESK